ncbi:trypsin-like serine peptidase [Bacteriovorax sp. BSW11_IV]|uniref:trypsin-like serine peptidase n=1 Tax=Bacteriovorax sp. BSW11_IV TaxID=1353529 RepID=UPI0009DC4108|nr:serine protease [Bacteriovorax sp. BSW11_IV]
MTKRTIHSYSYRTLILVGLVAIFLSACGKKKNLVTSTTSPKIEFYNACIVWNGDSREEITRSSYNDRLAAKSVALMMPNWAMSDYDHFQKRVRTENLYTVGELVNLCTHEKFANEFSYGNCTGFLVDKDIMLTAGHCFDDGVDNIHANCDKYSWVFDMDSDQKYIPESNIYGCKEVLIHSVNSTTGEDFTLFRLDRNVRGRRPLKIDYDYRPNLTTDMAIIGHPLGMKKMIAKDKGSFKLDRNDDMSFYYLLDTFPSNSGSPIFDQQTGKVIGLHVAGDRNYLTKDEKNNCMKYTNCTGTVGPDSCAPSKGILLSSIKNYIDSARSCQ